MYTYIHIYIYVYVYVHTHIYICRFGVFLWELWALNGGHPTGRPYNNVDDDDLVTQGYFLSIYLYIYT